MYAVTDGTAVDGTDYSSASSTNSTVSWADGDASDKTISIPISTTTPFSGSKSFSIALVTESVVGGASVGTPSTAAITITGSGVPGSLAFSSASYTVSQGGGSLQVQVNRTGGSSGAVSASYTTSNGTALAGTDYTAISGTVSWTDGDSVAKTISIPVSNTTPFSGSKSFSIALTSATLGAPSTAALSINGSLASSAGVVALSQASYSITQVAGSTTTVTMTVNRSGGSSGAISVAYATGNGTASAGTHYTATSGSLNWADGDAAAKTFTVPILGGSPFTSTKTFNVTLSSATGGATVGTPSTAAVTITGNGVAGSLVLSSAAYAVTQTSGTTSVTVTVNRGGGGNIAASVAYATSNGTATAGTEYTSVSGTLSWAAGDTAAKTFTVPILGSNPFTGGKTFNATLSSPTGGATVGTPGAAVVTITGNGLAGTLVLSSATYAVTQTGGTTSMTVTVNRGGGGNSAVSVAYATSNGTATAGTHYTSTSGTLSWAAGDAAAKTFTVSILGSTPFTGGKTFNVTLSSPTGGASVGAPGTAVVTISGNGVAGTLVLSSASYAVTQTSGTTSLTVTVNRGGGGNSAVSVAYATSNGTATSGTEYTSTSGTLSWAAGDATAKTFTVSVLGASPFTGSKTFNVTLSSPTGGASVGTPGTAVVTITGSGAAAGSLALSASTYTIAQLIGNTISLTVTVNRTGGTSGAVGVSYATSDGTALAGTHYTNTSGTLSWAAGDATAKTFAVPILGSISILGGKTFNVTLSAATGGASVGTPSSAAATINGSAPQVSVDGSSNVATISSRQLGTNLGYWASDVTDPATLTAVQDVGAQLVRWPGGTNSDNYHWQNHSDCNTDTGAVPNTATVDPVAYLPTNTFPNFVAHVLAAGNLEGAITVNYGTNVTCDGGADPHEAAAWVAYVKTHSYNIHYWTVGNEQFGGWEPDLHTSSVSGQTHVGADYVKNVNGANGFYALMKAQDPTAKVGVVVEGAWDGLSDWDGWDAAVLGCATVTDPNTCATKTTGAKFDFVELHYYEQQPGSPSDCAGNGECDSYLLGQAITDFSNAIANLRVQLVTTGHPSTTPIMLGEYNSVAYSQGKQTMSIVNALNMGMVYGEIFKNQVDIATLWFGVGGNQGCDNNNSSTLYGWQNFGGYDAVAWNTASAWNNCGSGPNVPEGTVFPTGQAEYLAGQFAVAGNHILTASVDSSLPNVRVYAATQGTGYALMMFNLSKTATTSVTTSVSNASGSSFTGSMQTYGKAQYDDSKNNVWTGPVSQSLGTVGSTVTVSLPPWSMTVVKLQ